MEILSINKKTFFVSFSSLTMKHVATLRKPPVDFVYSYDLFVQHCHVSCRRKRMLINFQFNRKVFTSLPLLDILISNSKEVTTIFNLSFNSTRDCNWKQKRINRVETIVRILKTHKMLINFPTLKPLGTTLSMTSFLVVARKTMTIEV